MKENYGVLKNFKSKQLWKNCTLNKSIKKKKIYNIFQPFYKPNYPCSVTGVQEDPMSGFKPRTFLLQNNGGTYCIPLQPSV